MRADKLVLKVLRRSATALDAAGVASAIEADGGPGLDVVTVERALSRLERSGMIARVGEAAYRPLRERNLVVGRLSMNRKGFGFVSTPVGDIYVGRRDTAGAMHGDVVSVRLHTRRKNAGRSGEVVQVLERGITEIVGRFERHGGLGIVVPSDARIRGDLFVDLSRSDAQAKPGDVVVARITRYGDRRDAMQGVITEVLGPEDAPGVDVEIVIREHGLATGFPAEVTEAAEALVQDIDAEVEDGRRDVRDLFTFTIDPADARDFDDAISIQREGKSFRLWVHIADVSHYVPWDSAIDVEARHRATSVYLVDRVLPMLPERLSNVICSLNPGEDRLAFTVEMLVDKTGAVERYECYPSVIRSDRRFDYDQVQGWLDGGGYPDPENERALADLHTVAAWLHDRRVARGALDRDGRSAGHSG